MRDDIWLAKRLDLLWRRYFPDIKKVNEVTINFSTRDSKFRFGSIRLVKQSLFAKSKSKILINRSFKDKTIPEEVVDYTICHELVHYAHGFSSDLPKLHRYPHHGKVVHEELSKRGLRPVILIYEQWLKQYRTGLKKRLFGKRYWLGVG